MEVMSHVNAGLAASTTVCRTVHVERVEVRPFPSNSTIQTDVDFPVVPESVLTHRRLQEWCG